MCMLLKDCLHALLDYLRYVPRCLVLPCRQAKLDALTALSAAAEGYGPLGVHPHLSTVWLALRAELLAPAAPALLPADLASAQQVGPMECRCCLCQVF